MEFGESACTQNKTCIHQNHRVVKKITFATSRMAASPTGRGGRGEGLVALK